MPHISKRELTKENLENLYTELLKVLEKSKRNKKVSNEFFTKTERIMFAKRLAVIMMLSRGISVYSIADSLAMSPSTVSLMALKFEEGKYKNIIMQTKKSLNLLEIIEFISTAGGIMPAVAGKRRKL